MENLSQEIRVKKRDRWTCKRCGKRFVDLVVCPIDQRETDDGYITLCKDCEAWLRSEDTATIVCNNLLRKNKVVLIGDCHGQFEKLDEVLISELPFDFFISVGDVGDLDDITPQNIGIIDKWKSRGYFVHGNHDDVEFFTPLELSHMIRGIHVAGLNGLVRSRTFANDASKDISFREIIYLSHQKNVDILVTHQAPTGIFNGMGEPVLEELLNYLVPKIYVFGHIHQYKLKFHLQTFMISLPMVNKGHAVAYFQGNDLRNLEIVLKNGKKTIRV